MKGYNIRKVINLCRENYKPKTFYHALRVANYAVENILGYILDEDELFCLALCHDLLEDADVDIKQITECMNTDDNYVSDTLKLLTHNKQTDTYNDYIRAIKDSKNKCAYIIKLADMKDHLSQTETLTEKLKEKYWNALPILL